MATAVARQPSGWLVGIKRLVENPQALMLLLALDVAAYFAGLIFWYGYVMTDPATPVWVWPFMPDCPFFGLLGGLGLLMVIARDQWSVDAQRLGQRIVWGAALGSLLVWLATFGPEVGVPGMGEGWSQQRAMFALW